MTAKLEAGLVGLDLGRISDKLVEWLPVLQRVGTRRLLLAHVIPVEKVEHVAGFPVDKLEEELRREALERLRAYAERLREKGFEEVEVLEPRVGEPAETLAALAEEYNADYIIVGNRGRGLLRSILLGSVSDELANISPRPVLVVKGFTRGLRGEPVLPPDPFEPEEPIVAAVTRDNYLDAVIAYSVYLASRTEQRLILAHVLEEENPEETRQWLESLARTVRAAGVEAEPLLLRGKPGRAIAREAEKLGAGLIVAGRGGTGGPLRGSTVDTLIRYARSHVFVATRPG